MDIKVNEQAQRFYLAYENGWIGGVGHEIKVGKYRFSAVPTENEIIVSELTTGMKFRDFPVTPLIVVGLDKEGTINHLRTIGTMIKKIINKIDDFDKRIKNGRKETTERFGKMPEIKNVNIDEIINEI